MDRISLRGGRRGPASARSLAALAALALVALLGAAGPAAAEKLIHDFHESWDVEKSDTFWLQHDDGDVTITPWDQDVLDVTVTYRASWTRVGVGSAPDFHVEAKRDDEGIHVRTREKGSSGMAMIMIQDVEVYRIEVRAPEWLVLDLRGDDGDVHVENWRARTRIRGSDGDVELVGCVSPSLRIEVDDGDVQLERCAAAIEVRTEDGDVQLEDVATDDLAISCDDGDVIVALERSENLDGDVRTEDGNVLFELPGDLPIEILLRTDDGDLRVDLPGAARVELSEETAYVELGGRDGRLRIETDDGDIRLRER
jgi:hypothetical protein